MSKEKIKESYSVVISTTSTCLAKDKIIPMLSDNEAGNFLKIKFIIGTELIMNRYPVYMDSVEAANQVGFVKDVFKDDKHLDNDDIKMIAEAENYTLALNITDGKNIEGFLHILVENGAANKSSNSELSEELKEAVERVIAEGLVDKEDMQKRLEVMTENHVDEYLQLRIINKYRKYNKPSHKPSCIFKDPYLPTSLKRKQEGIISEGLRSAAGRNAVICEGEKSVGKNVYLETIAWLMNMPMYLITFSRQMSPSSIYGEKTTDNTAAKALAEFDSNILAKAEAVNEKRRFAMNIYAKQGIGADEAMKAVDADLSDEDKNILEEVARFKMLQAQSASVNIVIDSSELYDWLIDGGILVFNEMNMAEANFFASFTNQLLDGTGFLFIPGRGEVAIHPDCVLFGTQNAEYTGVEIQNEATMSRFGCIIFPQPETIKPQIIAATEASIKKGDSPNACLDSKYFTECQNFYKQCRDAVNKGVVTNACLNIRGFVRALTAVAESNGYAKLKRQIQIHVINTCPVDDRVALNATLEQMVTL